jgi:hypothetical protein
MPLGHVTESEAQHINGLVYDTILTVNTNREAQHINGLVYSSQ